MVLIDKETIRTEIERRYKEFDGKTGDIATASRLAYLDILSYLDALPEQPVGGLELEQEILSYIRGMGFGYGGWVDGLEDEDLCKLARHFAEWGADHLRGITKMVPEELEEAAKNRVTENGRFPISEFEELRIRDIKFGAEWVTEHLKNKDI